MRPDLHPDLETVLGAACLGPAPHGSPARDRGVFIVSTTVSDNFVTDYTNFILVLAYLLVPWSVVNLVDYYLVHKGHYDPESFSDPTSGYGAFNVPALLSYVLGCLVQIR